jgi:hypothetical protein
MTVPTKQVPTTRVPSKRLFCGTIPAILLVGLLSGLSLQSTSRAGQEQPVELPEVERQREAIDPDPLNILDLPEDQQVPEALDVPSEPFEFESPPEVEIPEQPPSPIIADELRQQLDEAEAPLPLNRGPVHEAFAEAFSLDPQPGIVVPERPPEAIEEIPPDTRPEDTNLSWFPGYWGWDAELEQFIWVSGSWRRPPPYRRWLPGYWNEVDEGWQWIPGTWIQAEQQQLDYLPEPPESLETGPTTDAPSEQHIWIPGCWMWQQSNYAWRPGYWSRAHADWVWMPHRYLWTPYGCVFSRGYWDYPIARRGWLFAPHYFPYRRAGFFFSPFTPNFLISHRNLMGNFWILPGYRHYFFGNYFGLAGRRPGFMPWHQFYGARRGYDPLFWHQGRGFPGGVRAFHGAAQRDFDRWVREPQFRPPATVRGLESFRGRVSADDFDRGAFARSLRDGRDGMDRQELGRSRRISDQQRRELADGGRRMNDFSGQRRQFESRAASQLADRDRGGRRSEPLGLPSTRVTERRDVRRPASSPQLGTRRPEATRQGLQRPDIGRGAAGRGPSVNPGLQPSRRPSELQRGARGTDRVSPQFRSGSPRPTPPQFRGDGIPRPSSPSFRGGGSPRPTPPSFRGGGSPRPATPSFRGGGGSGRPSAPSFRGGGGGGRSSGPSMRGGGGGRSSGPSMRGGGGGSPGRGAGGGGRGGGRDG